LINEDKQGHSDNRSDLSEPGSPVVQQWTQGKDLPREISKEDHESLKPVALQDLGNDMFGDTVIEEKET